MSNDPTVGRTRASGKEQFYTQKDTAKILTSKMITLLGEESLSRNWIEPAGGTGAFIDSLMGLGITAEQIESFDIEPKHELVKHGDFLSQDFSRDDYLAITNPPFGRNNKLSVPFFNKLAKHCTHIGFIVPKSWRKWSVQDKLDKSFHLIHDRELQINYVDDTGQPINNSSMLKTVFQIWEKRDYERESVQIEDRGYLKKVSREEATVNFTAYGRNVCKVEVRKPEDPPFAKHSLKLWLKVRDNEVLEALAQANFKQYYENTAFIEALSWREINAALNEWFDARY